jgi:voltage-gated potassium channel Kch
MTMDDSNDRTSLAERLNLKHMVLMVVLLGLIVCRPLLPSAIADTIFLPTMIVSAWLAGGKTRRSLIVTVFAGIGALGLLAVDLVAHEELLLFMHAPAGFFIGVAVLALFIYCGGTILHSLVTAERVFINEIVGTFNVYLIMGYTWSFVYVLLESLSPGSFQFAASTNGSLGVRMLYFSFVTLTTIGYGDTVPVSPLAQMLVIVEAIVGQFYVAIVVAYLVSMHIIHKLETK